MKCLTNKQIQQQMDGETSSVLSEKYNQHMDACPPCMERYHRQQELAQTVKKLINATAQSPERTPEFRIPKMLNHPARKIRRIPGWLKIAALLIPVFFIWKMTNKPENFKPSAENIRMYEMSNGVDANTAFQENMIITTVTDENGNIVTSNVD